MTDFEDIVNELSAVDSVSAIVIAGSNLSGVSDELSDIDMYVYTDDEIPLDYRKNIFVRYAKELSLDNRYWELGDEMRIADSGIPLDIMYRAPAWIQSVVHNVYQEHHASLGYTTCFLFNIINSKILYDPSGWFLSLQSGIKSYPDELAKRIIEKNLPLLKDKKYASYYSQISNAISRNDYVSVNHRLSAFFASYFDILFAYNRVYHPGEKRLVRFVLDLCGAIPEDFEKDVNAVLCADYSMKLTYLDLLIKHLYELISREF